MRLFFAYLLVLVGLVACQTEPATEEQSTTDTTETTEVTAPSYTISSFTPSEEYADATMNSMTYENGIVKVDYDASVYRLGQQTPDAGAKMCANSGKGQHIHLIVDNGPYAAKYVNQFEHTIEDGEHYILAFLSRSYHESIKNGKASAAKKVTVENKAFTTTEDITTPMLFYSRPKGTYVGKANTDKVMLDFFLANANLGTDYSVKLEINGEYEKTLDTWQPYYIEGLPMGDNKIKLTLVDAAGNVIDAPLNPVERVFTLKADPVEEI